MPNTQIDLFFKDPNSSLSPDGIESNLFLLRREIRSCFGYTGYNCEGAIKTLWAGTMCIMAGIDLLAKFHANEIIDGEASNRFKDFSKIYISEEASESLFQLRNALMHSFGLYGQWGADEKKKEFHFSLSVKKSDKLYEVKNGKVRFYIHRLFEMFEDSINSFQSKYKDLESYEHFEERADKYGWTNIKEEE